VCAEFEKLIEVVHVGRLNESIDFRLEIILFHEPLIGAGSYGKAIGDSQLNPVPDLSQVSHLAAHLVRHVFIHRLKREDQGPLLFKAFALNILIDFFPDLFELPVEVLIFSRGKIVQIFDDLPDAGRYAG